MSPNEVLEPVALSLGAYVLAFVLGTLFGSFANVCIYRWPPSDEHPRGRSVVRPGSHCFACGAAVKWYDNMPLVSFLLLRGQCRACGAEFSARYLLVEAALGMLFVAAYHFAVAVAFPFDPLSLRIMRFLILAAFCFFLVVITFIDLDHKLILDKITYPAIPIFYGLGLLLPERQWPDGLIGAAVGYGVVRLISDGYYYLTGREGLGYGDGKLLAVIGALYGWQAVVVSLFAGSVIGSIIGISVIIIMRRVAPERPEADVAAPDAPEADAAAPDAAETDAAEAVPLGHIQLPFGPFLAAGAILYAFVEPWLDIRFVGL
jgi:leader peptidase (prepilin peptidase)/N-methyltransferase